MLDSNKPSSASAAPPLSPADLIAMGYKAYRDRHYHEAARHFELAARSGLVEAQYELGQMFEKGLGVRKDSARARKLYEAAARQEHILAMEQMAHFVSEGIGGDKNPDEGKQWQDKALKLKSLPPSAGDTGQTGQAAENAQVAQTAQPGQTTQVDDTAQAGQTAPAGQDQAGQTQSVQDQAAHDEPAETEGP